MQGSGISRKTTTLLSLAGDNTIFCFEKAQPARSPEYMCINGLQKSLPKAICKMALHMGKLDAFSMAKIAQSMSLWKDS